MKLARRARPGSNEMLDYLRSQAADERGGRMPPLGRVLQVRLVGALGGDLMNQCQHPQSRIYTFRYSAACNIVATHLLALALVFATQGQASIVAASVIQIGYCGSIKDIDAAKAAGFDYFEPRTSEVAALSDAEYDKLTAKLKQGAMPSPVAYWFVPADIKLTGPSIDKANQAQYLERALSRMSRLGVHVIVFGSSGARNYPQGFAKHDAFDQLVDFGKRTGPIARKYGITIAIEAQRREESNIINTTQESLQWVNAVNDPNIQLMVDYYHFESEKEDPAMIVKVKDHLRHIHMGTTRR
jgi:hypothetical protein